ncbi:alpha/beta hydrolase [Kribbella sp. CA-293567]|uniref:alpha/beta hydrolase n=1 Tax=Kribbella sp. CA-293567 TaxID=3002436 RepID=UPI0022DDC807|nr:alpha/beta fold hydrolase [Kribbella sp. CA-293567]WBQ06717.1 alpha/beta fold hydrolase [Kribbella sp. CA-293567]
MMRRFRTTVLLLATTLLAGLLSGSSAAQAGSPMWTGLTPCAQPELAAYLCGELTVRLDRDDRRSKTLDLPVLVAGDPQAKRTMLLLTGGPGQPGPSLAPRVLQAFEGIKNDYRIVMLDQRGTGANALNCPELQSERGGNDLRVPSRAAVLACAATLGADREHYATTDSVADFEDLRRALSVDRWALNGVSYGTYTAQRYAAAHGSRVTHLVLDSTVPVDAFRAELVETFPEHARVLRDVCAAPGRNCPGDPAEDLSAVLRREPALGPKLLEAVTMVSYFDPVRFLFAPEALHAAAGGDNAQLQQLFALVDRFSPAPAAQYSQGIQAATLCLDLEFPWGGAQSAEHSRARKADRAVSRITPEQLWPYNATAARSNGEMVMCEYWPKVRDREVGRLSLRGVNALLLHGERDLGTPLVWAREAQRDLPGSRLVVVPDGGHSLQVGGAATVRETVTEFLLR